MKIIRTKQILIAGHWILYRKPWRLIYETRSHSSRNYPHNDHSMWMHPGPVTNPVPGKYLYHFSHDRIADCCLNTDAAKDTYGI